MSTKYISEKDDNLIICFDYNPFLVAIIKRITGRKFDSDNKVWTVPKQNTKEVLDVLLPLGFSYDPQIQETYQEKTLLKKKIERILAGNFKQSEIDLFEKTQLPLLPFQKIGSGFLCVTGSSLLADSPGCGKSIQSLATTLIREAKKVLIICPATLKLSWKDELEKWIPDAKITVISGTKKERDELWKENSLYYLANYELLLKDLPEMQKIEWDFLIADEATRISNIKAKQSILIKKIKAKHILTLTGTPLNNKIEDVYNVIDLCNPGVLGNYWSFINKYCIKQNIQLKDKINKDGKFIRGRKVSLITGYKNLGELKTTLSDFMIRRKKEEVLLELPPKLYETVYVEFTKEEKEIYKNVQENIVSELKELTIDKQYLNEAMVKIVRLKQVCDSLELVSDIKQSSKILALKELLGDILHDNSKVIVFSQFSTLTDILMRELSEYNPLLISGKVGQEQRNENIRLFNEDDKHKVLCMTEAGSMGINLQRANYVVHFDLPWSISKKIQREDRCHRKGQLKNVTVYQLIVKDSVDEYIIKVLNKKEQLSDSILGDSERLNKVKISKADINKLLK
jgi:SNF2 family DNA or RNA helicase